MDRKRNISGGSGVEERGGASLSTMARETHGRASLRAMPAGTTQGRAFLLVAMLLLFGACEKEVLGDGAKGETVPILFSVDMGGYGAGGEVVRSAGGRATETVAIPLNDEVYLEATLMPNPEGERETTFDGSQLRAAAPFINNQKVCFVAYNASTEALVDSKVYNYSGGKLVPVSTPLGVVPGDGTVYRFAAYSYFGSTSTPSTSVNPVNDLVWGKAATDRAVVDTEVSRTVAIHMEHKFAQVMVRVKSNISGFTIEGLSGVGIEGGKQVTLNPFNGNISEGSSVTQDVGSFTTVSTTERESGYRTVLPMAAGSAKVRIGSVTVKSGSTTYPAFTNRVAEFSSSLNVAASYVLVVDLKGAGRWARSNVVWDNTNSKLTFATTTEENTGTGAIPANVQGVFFRWGSLVALDPTWSYTNKRYPDGTILYSATGNYNLNSSLIDIPMGDITGAEDEFAAYNGGTGFNASLNKGDICRYITAQGWVSKGSWRLPTVAEWQALYNSGSASSSPASQSWGLYYDDYFTGAPRTGNNLFGFYVPAFEIRGQGPDNSLGSDNPANPRILNTVITASGSLSGGSSNTGRTFSTNHVAFYWTSGSSYNIAINHFQTDPGFHLGSLSTSAGAVPVRCIRSDI